MQVVERVWHASASPYIHVMPTVLDLGLQSWNWGDREGNASLRYVFHNGDKSYAGTDDS